MTLPKLLGQNPKITSWSLALTKELGDQGDRIELISQDVDELRSILNEPEPEIQRNYNAAFRTQAATVSLNGEALGYWHYIDCTGSRSIFLPANPSIGDWIAFNNVGTGTLLIRDAGTIVSLTQDQLVLLVAAGDTSGRGVWPTGAVKWSKAGAIIPSVAISAANIALASPIINNGGSVDLDETVAIGNNARVAVAKNSGATVGTRRKLNFIEGSNVTLTIADDAGNEEVDVTIAAASGGGSATTVEVDLGSAAFAGKFTITDAAISGTSKVLCWQAPGPYTGKGARADEAAMQQVLVIAVEPLAGTAVVHWQTPPMVTARREPDDGRLNAAGATFDRLGNQRWPDEFIPTRLGKVKGNVKFTYMVI